MISNVLRTFTALLWFYFLILAVLDKDDDEKSRVLNEVKQCDQPHCIDDGHNPDYDHEAFLEEAEYFDELSPEKIKLRLGKIFDKMDTNEDSYITQDELKAWIDLTQRKCISDDVRRQWSLHNPKNENEIEWEEYKSIVYGFMDAIDPKDIENNDEGGGYMDMLRHDRRRWEYADEDVNNFLTFEEFTNFVHPEESTHMKDFLIMETMKDIDKDEDGKISFLEYIGDMYKGNEGENEPSWVTNEREQFHNFRDKNKDGFMSLNEIRDWIIPTDHSEAEANHLIYESDANGDKKLTKKEVLDNYDVFVGSQAIEFGEEFQDFL